MAIALDFKTFLDNPLPKGTEAVLLKVGLICATGAKRPFSKWPNGCLFQSYQILVELNLE